MAYILLSNNTLLIIISNRNDMRTFILLLATLITGTANAGLITFGSLTASSPNNYESFDRSGANAELASTQFSGNGITFNSIAGGGPTSHINSSCNVGGLTGSAWVSIGVTGSCGVARGTSISEILFDENVSELSFLFRTNNSANYLFESFLDGAQDAQLTVSSSIVGNTTQFLFTGSFDRIRFTEQVENTWFWIDDLSWKTTSVPEPSTLGLLSLTLLGLGFKRRQTKS